jgi:hypothetical protein
MFPNSALTLAGSTWMCAPFLTPFSPFLMLEQKGHIKGMTKSFCELGMEKNPPLLGGD